MVPVVRVVVVRGVRVVVVLLLLELRACSLVSDRA